MASATLNSSLFLILSVTLIASCKHNDDDSASDLEGLSPIRSTVESVNLRGTHIVVSDDSVPKIIRSQAPQEARDYKQLKALGLTDVLIFKEENKNEVTKEIEDWRSNSISGSHIKRIPMEWAGFRTLKPHVC